MLKRSQLFFYLLLSFQVGHQLANDPHDAVRGELDDVVFPCFSTGDPPPDVQLGVSTDVIASVKRQEPVSV